MLIKFKKSFDIILFFLVSCFLFTWGLSFQEITGFDSRFYLFVQEMLSDGLSWFPRTYHSFYPDYPATSTVIIYLLSNLSGALNKWVAVLPTAVLAALTIVMTYLIASLQSKRWGVCAIFLMLLTIGFIRSARSISLDMYPTFITTVCFYLLASADKFNRLRRVIWIYPLLILGFIFRGPIGLVIPAGVVCSYYLLSKRYSRMFMHGILALLLLCICTACLLMLAYYVDGYEFMQSVWKMEVMGRMDNPFLPRYFYFVNSFSNYVFVYPLACLVLLGFIFQNKVFHKENLFVWLLIGWMLVILMGMSIPDDKKTRYVLPMIPAASLIAAYLFIAPQTKRYFYWLRKIGTLFFFILPSILFFGVLLVSFYLSQHAMHVHIHEKLILIVCCILQIISIFSFFRLRQEIKEMMILGIAALGFTMTNMVVVEPIQQYLDRGRDFVMEIEAQRIRDKARLVFYREQPDGFPIKYLINMPHADQPLFVSDEKNLASIAGPAYFITSESYFQTLPLSFMNQFQVIANNSLGHNKIVVFKKKE